ncbi:hypothetical protein GC722_10895, partial [Auraticoccus sp. F435]|nr:hypothetical protein [Auraticoccus cholistanensis]
MEFDDGTTVTYTYDAAGNVATRTDPTGTTTYGYDQLYRLTYREHTDGNGASFGGGMSYVWDKASQLQAQTTDAGGVIFYDYDDSGVPTKIDYPDGDDRAYLTITTDDNGRRTATTMNSDSASAWRARTNTSYDAAGRVTKVTADTGTGDNSYTRTVDVSYCYVKSTTAPNCTANTAGDRSKLQWQRDNITGAVTTYSYDTSGRLTSAVTTGAGAKTHSYTYNSNGNRLTAARTGATTQTLTYNPANQITTSGFAYDGAGNLTAQPGKGTMTYTAANQLDTVTRSGTTYTYDHAGLTNDELITQTTPEGTYRYAYGRTNPQGLPVLETVGKDNNTASILNDPRTGQP